jgi:hypothetical protein
VDGPSGDAIDIFTNAHCSITADGRRELEWLATERRVDLMQWIGKVRHKDV